MSSPEGPWSVIAVVGGCGGAGASALSAALAWSQTGSAGTPVLVDLDGLGGGIDILLGAETSPGARWSGLHATGDRLDPAQLRDGLPRWSGVSFLACDGPREPSADAVRSVIRASRQLGPTVLDIGRHPSPARTAALGEVQHLVLVAPGEIRACTAAAAQLASLAEAGFTGEARLVVRQDRAAIGARRMAQVLDTELAGGIGVDRGLGSGRDRGVQPRRLSRATVALTRAIMLWAAPTGRAGRKADAVAEDAQDPSTTEGGDVANALRGGSRSGRPRIAPSATAATLRRNGTVDRAASEVLM